MILGFTGTFGAGKGTVIEIIAREYGAPVFSLSDEIRAECKRLGIGLQRDNLLKVGNGMRKKRGGGYWAKKVAEKIKKKIKEREKALVCIDSIRAPEEVEELRRQFGKEFKLVAVDAPVEIRYQRVRKRARAGEHSMTFEEFKASEMREQSAKGGEASIRKTMGIADIFFDNIGNQASLQIKIGNLVPGLSNLTSPF